MEPVTPQPELSNEVPPPDSDFVGVGVVEAFVGAGATRAAGSPGAAGAGVVLGATGAVVCAGGAATTGSGD